MSATDEQLREFLKQFAASFAADGAQFQILESTPHSIRIHIKLTKDTCRDCIMPQDVIQEIIEQNVLLTFGLRPPVQIVWTDTLSQDSQPNAAKGAINHVQDQ